MHREKDPAHGSPHRGRERSGPAHGGDDAPAPRRAGRPRTARSPASSSLDARTSSACHPPQTLLPAASRRRALSSCHWRHDSKTGQQSKCRTIVKKQPTSGETVGRGPRLDAGEARRMSHRSEEKTSRNGGGCTRWGILQPVRIKMSRRDALFHRQGNGDAGRFARLHPHRLQEDRSPGDLRRRHTDQDKQVACHSP